MNRCADGFLTGWLPSISFIVTLSSLKVGRLSGCSSQHFSINMYLIHEIIKKILVTYPTKLQTPIDIHSLNGEERSRVFYMWSSSFWISSVSTMPEKKTSYKYWCIHIAFLWNTVFWNIDLGWLRLVSTVKYCNCNCKVKHRQVLLSDDRKLTILFCESIFIHNICSVKIFRVFGEEAAEDNPPQWAYYLVLIRFVFKDRKKENRLKWNLLQFGERWIWRRNL